MDFFILLNYIKDCLVSLRQNLSGNRVTLSDGIIGEVCRVSLQSYES